ncbi:glycoside hydrolase [Mycobacterium sp. GA-1199]|uniref:C40 family peptidase n=1 Tax=Mycobacterium sp. GA-1199 TaxID=1772287 RepID=UPI00074929EF|nr:C40 family peptidase [Mycobacterium sp. GA-1199]KUI48421.1 glycoside hydrolase [Mycobacterium sp. GA-1199]
MPSALIAGLTAPLRDVQSLVGSGSATELATALRDAHNALREVSASVDQTWGRAAQHWAGAGADAAADVFTAAVTRTDELAERVGRLGSAAETAGAAVARARERLIDIVDTFETRAAALEPFLDSPGVTEELVAEARRSLAEAVAVVDELRAELDGHAAGFPTASSAPMTGPAPTSPAGFTAPTVPSSGFGGGGPGLPMGAGGLGSSSGGSGASTGGLGSLVRDIAEWSRPEPPDAARFGEGVAVRLPDGSTATAPNAVAASAVRYALTQLGVPYDWGGTTPGVGLDCSGLTQWAYSEAGLNLPRLAQEQDVGVPVAPGDLRPGDLAVWDGHVAMVVGNGQMIEAISK